MARMSQQNSTTMKYACFARFLLCRSSRYRSIYATVVPIATGRQLPHIARSIRVYDSTVAFVLDRVRQLRCTVQLQLQYGSYAVPVQLYRYQYSFIHTIRVHVLVDTSTSTHTTAVLVCWQSRVDSYCFTVLWLSEKHLARNGLILSSAAIVRTIRSIS